MNDIITISSRERWALTFVLETYFDIPEQGYHYDGGLIDKAIKQGLKILFNQNIRSPENLSMEIKRRTGSNISSAYLKRYADGVFIKLRVVELLGEA